MKKKAQKIRVVPIMPRFAVSVEVQRVDVAGASIYLGKETVIVEHDDLHAVSRLLNTLRAKNAK